jgi:hypothetical protein
MTPTASPFSLTAIGTVRGRVSRPELCLTEIEREIRSLFEKHGLLDRAPFESMSVVIHLGDANHEPKVWGVDARYSVLEIAVGVPFAQVRRHERTQVCDVMRNATFDAVLAGCQQWGLPDEGLRAARQPTAE